MLVNAAASLLLPLVLTAGLETPPPPPLHYQVRAFVTGYNTVPGQTDSTPCIAASGADICGRHDAVACPRHIRIGTTVEIRGATYVCEDRLARKYDSRFDISCDKDMACPYQVAGWTTIKVYDTAPTAAAANAMTDATPVIRPVRAGPPRPTLLASYLRRSARSLLASAVGGVAVLRGHS